MIVTEQNVSDALAYLADDPHPVAHARKLVTDSENKSKAIFARVFMSGVGPVANREAQAEGDPDYISAKAEEADAVFELERHRARVRAAEMLIEVWRSENANARAAERIR